MVLRKVVLGHFSVSGMSPGRLTRGSGRSLASARKKGREGVDQSLLTSTMSRLVSPRHRGKIHVASGEVRSGNHRAPPVVRPHCAAAQHTISCEPQTGAQESVHAYQVGSDSGFAEPERG